jgi:hypothetical protein
MDMSTTKENEQEQGTTTGAKPQPPAPAERPKVPLPDKIPEFPGEGGSGGGTTPTGK